MNKTQAIELLGGSVTAAAQSIGISYEAVYKWPDTLTPRIRDRVEAAISRKSKPGIKSSLIAKKCKLIV